MAYLEAENAWTEHPHRPPRRACARRSSRRSRRRTQETDLSVPYRMGDWWYYGRTPRGQAVRRELPLPRRGPRRLDPAEARGRRRDPRRAGAARRRRAGRGPRVLLPRRRVGEPGRPPARLQHRHRRRRALPAAGQGPPHRRAAARRGAEHPRRRHLGPARHHLFYTTVDDAWRPDKVWRHVLGTPVADDVVVHHETDERFWRRGGPHPQRPVPGRRVRLEDHLGVRRPRRRRPDRRVPGRRTPPRRAWSTPSSTP